MARAGILCLVLALHGVASCPVERVDAASRGDPRIATAAAETGEVLAALGVRVRAEDVVALFASASNAWCDVQGAVMRPLDRPFAKLQVHQRWGLFTGAPPVRWRLDVEARDGAAAPYRLLYRPHDPRHRWLADRLEYRRLRGIWNPNDLGVTQSFPQFVGWVAHEVFVRDARATDVRVRVFSLHLAQPGASPQSVAGARPAVERVVHRGEEGRW